MNNSCDIRLVKTVWYFFLRAFEIAESNLQATTKKKPLNMNGWSKNVWKN